MSKITKTLEKLADGLVDGETVISGLRVNLKGTALGVGFAAMGGVLPALAGGKAMKPGQDQAEASGIPFSQQMALGLTTRRIIIWSRSALSGKPKEIIGEIGLTEVSDATFAKGKLGDLISLIFAGGKKLELESVKVDKGEEFVAALKKSLGWIRVTTVTSLRVRSPHGATGFLTGPKGEARPGAAAS
jgi:hypothetical protein